MRIGFLQVVNSIDVNYHYSLNFAYLKSYLNTHLETDFQFSFLPLQNYFTMAKDLDILCISCYSQDFDDAKVVVGKFKKLNPNLVIILGGQHITNFPQTLPLSVDIGVIGEGEITFLKLIELYANDQRLSPEALKSINGLILCNASGQLIQTEPRQLIENLDDIGLPDRDFYPNDKRPYLFTSRGCPYKCTFCGARAFWGKPRYFSPEYVCADIKNILRKYPDLRLLSILDDLFVADRNRLRKIRDLLYNDGTYQNFSFEMACQIRAHLVDEDLCKLLQELRITSIGFGFESASDRFLKILKPGASVESNLEALDLLKKFNIHACCSFIIGVPGETEEDVKNTYELILDLMAQDKLVEPHVNLLTPMPNTMFWKEAEKEGFIDMKNMRWNRLYCCFNFRDTAFKSPEEWVAARLKNKSIYLNEDHLKEERLLELIVYYENEIIKEMEKKKAQAKPPYPYYAHIDLSNKNNAHALMVDKVKVGSYVLECGSSGGHMTRILAQKKCNVDCIEIDKTVANLAAPFAGNVYVANLEDGDFLKTLKNSSYDFIICGDILEHLRQTANCLLQLKEKLKPGGKIIASIPNIAHGSVRLKLLKGRFEYEDSGLLDRSHLKFFDFYSVVELFNDAKLLIESIDAVRILLEHPIANIDLSEYEPAIVEKIKQDSTSDVFQFVICAGNMTSSDEANNVDLLCNQLSPASAPTAVSAPAEPPPTPRKTLSSKIKGQISSLICFFAKEGK
jgi:radical SAM superfamily enzyme YgiQ (UPF0313 family)